MIQNTPQQPGQQQLRPPYVRFERRAVEDRTQSLKDGKYGFKDVDVAKITVPGQKDTVERFVEDWLKDVRKMSEDGRVPYDWFQQFSKAYEFWKSGQEMPVNGTPIRGWPVVSPAQQETLLQSGILSVEDLAHISDEAARNIGIGAVALKQKATAWLLEAKSMGVVSEENAALRVKLDEQAEQIKSLMAAVEDLKTRVPKEAAEPVSAAKF